MARRLSWALTDIPISMPCIPAGTMKRCSSAPSMYLQWTATICGDLPLSMRKANLARRPDGIFVSDFEQGEIGPDLFRKACEFGFEGLVSKRRDRRYRAGRSKHWIKIKNREHPAMSRVMEAFA
jgi:hypothetical protein